MKRIVIISIFVLPILVFLFLKFFGKNEFDIPVLYKDESPKNNCGLKFASPYKIPDSVMQKLNARKSVSCLVVDSLVSEKDLERIIEKFPVSQVEIVNLKSFARDHAKSLRDCFLFLAAPNNVVLIDSSRQIRGYYALPELDEMDKLEVELNVLLKKY